MSAHTPTPWRGPDCERQGTWQETYAGSWIVSHEGSPVIKRELRFAEDGAPAGWELLGGNYDGLVRAVNAHEELVRTIRAAAAALERMPAIPPVWASAKQLDQFHGEMRSWFKASDRALHDLHLKADLRGQEDEARKAAIQAALAKAEVVQS